MTLRKTATNALLAGVLAGASLGASAQSNPIQTAWAPAGEIDVQFTRVRSADELKRLCGGAIADAGSRSCSFAQPVGAGRAATCMIVSLEPESFNDVPRLVAFGREILNCMSASALPMAAGAKR